MFRSPRRMYAVSPPGLEPVLGRELAGLGLQCHAEEGGFEWEGGWRELIRAHLHLRTASRILVRIGTFRARALGELERKAGGLPWEALLPPGWPVRFRISAGRSRIYHEGAAAERLGRVLEGAGLRVHGTEPAPSSTPGGAAGSVTTVVVRIFRDQVIISVDASGDHLHQRGYRLDPGRAPLRENLAAGALLALGWDARAPLLDPFAGSGTIPIEAALLAMNVPPGLANAHRSPRGFAFLGWPGAPTDAFLAAVEEARRCILPAPGPSIMATDRDSRVLDDLRRNARRAGVLEHLQVEQTSLSRAPDPGPDGWVVTNPPYGTRLGGRKELRPLYRALGRRAREEWAGRPLAIFAADPVLARETRLELEEVLTTRNGGIRVQLLATARPG